MRSPPGERSVDSEGVVHRDHAHPIPGEAEVGAVDLDLGVEPDLAVLLDGRRGIEKQRPGLAAHGQRAGHRDSLRRGPDTVRDIGDVRMVAAVEEVSRPQVRVAPGDLRVDGRRGYRDGAAYLAVRRYGAMPDDLAENAVHPNQAHDLALQPYAGLARIEDPFSGQCPVLPQGIQRSCDHLF